MIDQKRSLEEIENEIAELSARIDEATYRLLVVIREFDERGGWAGQGARSCAHWLNWRVGLGPCAAREKVRVAHALAGLPLVAEAFRKGEVSYSKVRALTRIATPETESYLLDIARTGTASHMEKLVRGYRRVTREEADRQHSKRWVRTWWDRDGMLVVEGRLPPEAGAVLLKALEAAEDVLYPKREKTESDAGPREDSAESCSTPEAPAEPPPAIIPREGGWQHRADALALVAESAIGGGLEAASSTADRYQVVLHIDAEALVDETAPGRSMIEGGPEVSAESFRRITCDSSLVRIVEGASGEPLDVGRKTRTIPPGLRRALNARDEGCRWPGCDSGTRFLQAHHVRHWTDGGETSLSNTFLTCRFHHRLIHEGGYQVRLLPTGELAFSDPRGRPIGATGRTPTPDGFHLSRGDADPARALAALVDSPDLLAKSPFPTWLGEPMDYGVAVESLLTSESGGCGRGG